MATISLSRAKGDADIIHKIGEGIIRSISVGYIVHRAEVIERDRQIPLWRAVDWEPIEISAVPIPADPGAHIRKDGQRVAPATFPCAVVPASTVSPCATPDRRGPAFKDSPGWCAPLRR